MAIDAAKVVFHFQSGRRGWSETYWLIGGNANPDLNVAVATDLAKARGGLLPSPETAYGRPTLTDMTIGNPAVKRQAARLPVGPIVLDAATGNPISKGSGQRAAKVTLYTAGKTHRRILLLRGLPSDWADFDLNNPETATVKPATFGAKMNAFLNKLKAAGGGNAWGIHTPIWTPIPGGEVTGFSVGTNGEWCITMLDHGLILGQKIKVRNVRGPSFRGINGPTTVTKVIDADHFCIDKFQCGDCGLVAFNFGQVLILSDDASYNPFVHAFFSGWADRNTGGAIGVAPGQAAKCCGRGR